MKAHDLTAKYIKIDPTTKLVEYDLFIDLFKERLLLDPQETYTALLFIEFDDLRWFNDIFGFNIDHHIMIQLVEKLGTLLGNNDLLAKVDNNQYVIMKNLSEFESETALADKIIHILSEPFDVDSNMFYIYASIGISRAPMDDDNPHKLIRTAEKMMKLAQRDGRNNIMCTRGRSRVKACEISSSIITDLPTALENGEIYFLYHLQYSHMEKCFTGAEILARWDHPKYGEVSPEIFIPLAEKSGMIGPLTTRAIIEASKVFSQLRKKGIEGFSLSVNISPTCLMTSSFHETIKFLMEQYPLHGEKLNFEITEEIIMKNSDTLIKKFEQLKALGICIELDDFGTGYTSIQQLAYLPIDTLKIDKSFVCDIDKDKKKRALFKAIVDMSQALDINVIAEGVETNLENDIINTFESITVQGYFHSKPMPLEALITKLGEV